MDILYFFMQNQSVVKTAVILLLSAITIIILALYFSGISERQLEIAYPVFIAALIIGFLCFVVGELTKNYSQVDKLWSLLPVGYTWYFYLVASEPRILLMAVLATIWGIRLTYNFTRRGGYTFPPWRGEEDYRWAVIRANPFFKNHPLRWSLFNFGFISIYQSILILLFSIPPLFSIATINTSTQTLSSSTLNTMDIVIALFFLGFVIIETIADEQQYRFQTQKYALLNKPGASLRDLPSPYHVGFIGTGLWKWVRHPNYASEQAIWICFYLFSVNATDNLFNPSVIGAVLLVLLFFGSSNFSESITIAKYPSYREYCARTPRFIPNPFKK